MKATQTLTFKFKNKRLLYRFLHACNEALYPNDHTKPEDGPPTFSVCLEDGREFEIVCQRQELTCDTFKIEEAATGKVQLTFTVLKETGTHVVPF